MLHWYSSFSEKFFFAFEMKDKRLLFVRPPVNNPRWN